MSTLIDLLRRRAMLWLATCVALVATALPASAASRELPPEIHQALRESGRQFVAVVAADIDADGDLDVVAVDGSLHLLVWVNDGSGQFARKLASPERGGHTEAPAPGVDGHAPFANVYTFSDRPSFDAAIRSSIADPVRSSPLYRHGSDSRLDRTRHTRRLRGPPSDSSLN